MSMPLNELAGSLRLAPGRPASLSSSRGDWLPRLAAGRPAASLPTLVGALYSLCAHAHRSAAQAALAAARSEPAAWMPDAQRAHRLATAREHLLRLAQDWPRQLPGAPDDSATALRLSGCPLWDPALDDGQRLAALAPWLATHWLGESAVAWWAAAQQAPQDHAWDWAAASGTPLARLLHSQRAARALAAIGPALPVPPVHDPAWGVLGQAMGNRGFTLQPDWAGLVGDTGPWSRQATPRPADSAGDRLVARLVELVALAAAPEAVPLSQGAVMLAPATGLAWIEMARGLLVHRVQLSADGLTVLDARVLAPTEWNFHPAGTLARALSRLDPADRASAARLAVAFDPCVPFTIEPPPAVHNRPMQAEETPRCTS